MTASIYVRVGPGGSRNLIIASADLFEGYDKDSPEVCEMLYAGPRVEKTAELSRIKGSQNSHDKLTLKSKYSYSKANQSIYLCDEGDQRSLTNLFELLVVARHVDTEGEYVVINTSDLDIQSLIALLKDKDKLESLSLLMEIASDDENANALTQLALEKPLQAKSFAATINHARMSQALNEFREMVKDDNLVEQEFQDFLKENYWMFGSEYSELIPKRSIPYNKKLDFPLRRTVDGYLEVIEIKLPSMPLFRSFRAKKDTEYEYELLRQSPELSGAITQATDYIFAIDRQQDMISAESRHKIKADKVRAKVIIGRDDTEDKMIALRRLNALLHGIEVITYDQLISTAERILDILSPQQAVDDIPF